MFGMLFEPVVIHIHFLYDSEFNKMAMNMLLGIWGYDMLKK